MYNFGNVPVFIAIGTKRKTHEPSADGSATERRFIDYKCVLDERVCDGFYFSQAFRLFKSLLRRPHVLDEPPETIVEDIE